MALKVVMHTGATQDYVDGEELSMTADVSALTYPPSLTDVAAKTLKIPVIA